MIELNTYKGLQYYVIPSYHKADYRIKTMIDLEVVHSFISEEASLG